MPRTSVSESRSAVIGSPVWLTSNTAERMSWADAGPSTDSSGVPSTTACSRWNIACAERLAARMTSVSGSVGSRNSRTRQPAGSRSTSSAKRRQVRRIASSAVTSISEPRDAVPGGRGSLCGPDLHVRPGSGGGAEPDDQVLAPHRRRLRGGHRGRRRLGQVDHRRRRRRVSGCGVRSRRREPHRERRQVVRVDHSTEDAGREEHRRVPPEDLGHRCRGVEAVALRSDLLEQHHAALGERSVIGVAQLLLFLLQLHPVGVEMVANGERPGEVGLEVSTSSLGGLEGFFCPSSSGPAVHGGDPPRVTDSASTGGGSPMALGPVPPVRRRA